MEINKIPSKAHIIILEFLNYPIILSICYISKDWNRLCSNNEYWWKLSMLDSWDEHNRPKSMSKNAKKLNWKELWLSSHNFISENRPMSRHDKALNKALNPNFKLTNSKDRDYYRNLTNKKPKSKFANYECTKSSTIFFNDPNYESFGPN